MIRARVRKAICITLVFIGVYYLLIMLRKYDCLLHLSHEYTKPNFSLDTFCTIKIEWYNLGCQITENFRFLQIKVQYDYSSFSESFTILKTILYKKDFSLIKLEIFCAFSYVFPSLCRIQIIFVLQREKGEKGGGERTRLVL